VQHVQHVQQIQPIQHHNHEYQAAEPTDKYSYNEQRDQIRLQKQQLQLQQENMMLQQLQEQLQQHPPNSVAAFAAQYGFTMEQLEQQTPSYSKEFNANSPQNFKQVYDKMVAEQEYRQQQFPTVKKIA
ncbi:hypothetical protein PFISCL1PPCAC_8488, partial [Pristionchus fissidentatus]